ncbi:NAD(P)H-hydrate dehydratase [Noviherbaspirillum galbum]|uniref:NAD(P)H-hydrate dehydratase n=1 Tax=Noviherbaspirillum galbum TaxID=2709383 RepID=UPI002E27E1B9|nr:NAD(P)H-hydrate dehydratase [Noviherbaspirillum galbum]
MSDVRAIESAALAELPSFTLMQRAGDAAAAAAMSLLGNEAVAAAAAERSVLVLAGPGNNGGDALVAAANLAALGITVEVHWHGKEDALPPDARIALERARAAGLQPRAGANAVMVASRRWSLVIDGLFGIGLRRAIDGPLRGIVEAVNALACPVLALDVPSGLDADTGNVVGGGAAIRATDTISFIADKPGLHTGAGRDHAGRVHVADLQIALGYFPEPRCGLTQPSDFASSLRPRAQQSHKGSFGDTVLVGGAAGMAGALVLASRAALLCGSGRVIAAFAGPPPAYDPLHPEVMCRDGSHIDFGAAIKGALVLGPGLGTTPSARDLLGRALASEAAMLVDADGLNLLSAHDDLTAAVVSRATPAVLTPHPLEAARLLKTEVGRVQADRLAAARTLASRFRCIAVLKGSGTVIADPDGEAFINPTGNPALATGGSGDVLSGITGALLAQGWPPRDAALGGVWIHGRAADELAEAGTGPVGLAAGELIPAARRILNQLIHLHAASR